jgi:hypothetical protein
MTVARPDQVAEGTKQKILVDGKLRDAIEFEGRMYVAIDLQEINSLVLTETKPQRDKTRREGDRP